MPRRVGRAARRARGKKCTVMERNNKVLLPDVLTFCSSQQVLTSPRPQVAPAQPTWLASSLKVFCAGQACRPWLFSVSHEAMQHISASSSVHFWPPHKTFSASLRKALYFGHMNPKLLHLACPAQQCTASPASQMGPRQPARSASCLSDCRPGHSKLKVLHLATSTQQRASSLLSQTSPWHMCCFANSSSCRPGFTVMPTGHFIVLQCAGQMTVTW
mmetsp:Transcript_107854/g.230287  ORF Transcript_107854/g.230287 Transcript_107854/m.230287 type:complete len:216 (+) Transcript_107854:561-1208(+)